MINTTFVVFFLFMSEAKPPEEPAYQNQAQIDHDIMVGKYNMDVVLGFSAGDAVAHLAGQPQAAVLAQLYQTSHGNLTELRSVQALADCLGAELTPDDDALQRILVEGNPVTVAEEEYKHVWDLRGSLTLLAWKMACRQRFCPQKLNHCLALIRSIWAMLTLM